MSVRHLSIALVVLFVASVLGRSAYAEIDLETIVGMWLFDDEDNILVDSSPNGNNGEISGTKSVQGKFGEALEFDGVDDIITVPHSDELTLKSFTIAVWVKTPAIAAKSRGILRKNDGKGRNYQFRVQQNKGVPLLSFSEGGSGNWRDTLGVTRVDDEQWHHVAVTYDMESQRIYVDGVLDIQKEFNADPDTNTDPLLIGRVHGADFMEGSLDELIILNVPLEEEDIKLLMAGLEPIIKGTAVNSSDKLITIWGKLKVE